MLPSFLFPVGNSAAKINISWPGTPVSAKVGFSLKNRHDMVIFPKLTSAANSELNRLKTRKEDKAFLTYRDGLEGGPVC